MTEIYVNGQVADIDKDIAMSLNFAIADILNPDKRNTSFSKTIKLPGTKTNNILFSHIFDISKDIDSNGSANFTADYNPNLKADCKIFQENILQFNGMLQLKQINRFNETIEYEVVVYGNLKNLITEFEKKNIENLNLSRYDHNLTYTNFKNSWATSILKDGVAYNNFLAGNPKGEGYVYITADYGYTQSPVAMNLINAYPAIYVREILESMFREVGFTWTSAFLDSNFFKRLVIPFNKREALLTAAGRLRRSVKATTTYASTVKVGLGGYSNTQHWFGMTNEYEEWRGADEVRVNGVVRYYNTPSFPNTIQRREFDFFDNDSTLGNYDELNQFSPKLLATFDENTLERTYSGTGRFTAAFDGHYDFNVDIPISWTHTEQRGLIWSIGLVKEVNNIATTLATTIVSDSTQTTGGGTYRVTAKNVNLNEGEKVRFVMAVRHSTVFPYYSAGEAIFTFAAGATFTATPVTSPIIEGDLFYLNSAIPKGIPQKDFFLSIVKMFNLYVQPDPVSETNLIIAPLVDFYAAEEVVEWSDKVDYSKPAIIKPISELEGKDYKFKYKKDVDFYNADYLLSTGKEYGERNISVVNDFLKGEKKFELIFSPTPSFGIIANEMVIPRFVKENVNTGAVEPIDTNIRILYYGGVLSAGGSWTINDGTTVRTETTYAYAGHLDHPFTPTLDLLFDMPDFLYWGAPSNIGSNYTNNNLYNKYYSQFIEEITDRNSKVVELTVNLTPSDFAILDFKKLVHIDGINYRLNQIKDYNPGANATCKVVLSKIKKGIPFVPMTIRNLGTSQAVERFGLLNGLQDEARSRISSRNKIKRVDGTKDSVFFGETMDTNDTAGIDMVNGGKD